MEQNELETLAKEAKIYNIASHLVYEMNKQSLSENDYEKVLDVAKSIKKSIT